MTNGEKALAILQATHDGDDLDPRDLKATENAVNFELSAFSQTMFDNLYVKVMKGEYKKP